MNCTITGSDRIRTDCAGPTASGSCPLAEAGQPVACVGQELLVSMDGTRALRLKVDGKARVCPLAALGLLRDGHHVLKEGGKRQ